MTNSKQITNYRSGNFSLVTILLCFFPVRTAIAALARLKQSDIFSDGLHFNDRGNKFIAQEWTRALKAVLQGARSPK